MFAGEKELSNGKLKIGDEIKEDSIIIIIAVSVVRNPLIK